MNLPGSAAFHLCGLLCGVLLGWAGKTLLTAGPPMRSSAASLRAEAVAGGVGKSNAAEHTESMEAAGRSDAVSLSGHISPKSPKFDRALRAALNLADPTDRALRLREIVSGIPADELPEAFAQASKLAQSWEAFSTLGRRWAEFDPRAAAEFGEKSGTASPYNRFFLYGVMAKWADLAPAAAATWVESLPPGETRTEFTTTLLSAIARTDPQAALALLKSSPNPYASSISQTLFLQWARRDPQSAGAGALELGGHVGDISLAAVGRTWAQSDPAKALAWASGLSKASARKDVLGAIADQWADEDPRAEIRWARSLGDGPMRREDVARGLTRLAALDLPAALEQISGLPAGEDHDAGLMVVARSAADRDARAALKLLEQLPAGQKRNDARSELCDIWGQSDPRAALDWLVQNAVPPPSNDYNLYGGYGTYGLKETVRRWTSSAPQEAIAWAQSLPPGDARDSALAAIVSGLAATNFDRAKTVFDQLAPAAQPAAADAMTKALLSEGTGKARDWAESLPAGPAQRDAFQEIAQHWAAQNAAGAAEWLGTLPAGQSRDSAIGSFSRVAYYRDPEGAMAWVQEIDDPADRKRETEELVGAWLRTDSTAARAWLESSPQITPEEKANILHGN